LLNKKGKRNGQGRAILDFKKLFIQTCCLFNH